MDRKRMSEAGRLRAAINEAAELLTVAGVRSPQVDALALAAHALGQESLILAAPPPVDPEFYARYAALVERRYRREPLQHIVGWMAFRYLKLPSEPGTFVVRPETEVVAGAAIEEASALAEQGREPVVVDLCTGSGAIALAIATEVPRSRVHAVELSHAAYTAARRNVAEADNSLDHPIRLREGDARTAFRDLDGKVDIVVSNPPYIPPGAIPTDREVHEHDPEMALYGGGADGLEVPRGVVEAAARLLKPGGLLVMEHADVQAADVRAIVDGTGAFEPSSTAPDLTGRDRMVLARRR